MKGSFVSRGSSMTVLPLALMTLACAPSVPLENRPCPCADGWVCCPSGDLCAATASSCPAEQPAGTDGAAGATTATAGATGTDSSCASAEAGLPTLPDPAYAIQPALLGTWVGYFENFTFPSMSDAIRLSFTQNPDGTGKVSVVLGVGTPPAPPTNPTDTWPPDWLSPGGASGAAGAGGEPPQSPYIEGFAYDAHDVKWSAERVKFVINIDEPWQPWCQLQTSYAVDGAYRCIPGLEGGGAAPGGGFEPANFVGSCVAVGGDTPGEQPVSCMQAYACGSGSLCACDCTGCGANVGATASFDITFAGSMAAGNVTIGTEHAVMLTWAAPADGGQASPAASSPGAH